MGLKLIFKKTPTLPTGKIYVRGHVFMILCQHLELHAWHKEHTIQICAKRKKEKGRVFIRFLKFYPYVKVILKHTVVPLVSNKIITATIKDYPYPINLK